MADQSMFLHGPAPVGGPAPQVVLTFLNNQVQLQSNIVPGPQTWRVIAQMCLQGATAALNELAKFLEQQEGPRIVVPTLQTNGALRG